MATLLYVDDEVLIGKAVARWCERRGHAVKLAGTVASAKAAIGEHAPDAMSTRADRIWPTFGRPVLQKPFDFADLERSITDAEQRNST